MGISGLMDFLPVVVLIILLGILLLWNKSLSNKRLPTNATRKLNSPRIEISPTGEHVLASPPAVTDNKEEYPHELIPDELGISDIYGGIRKLMHAGIEAVFTPDTDFAGAGLPPPVKKKIPPETMTLILSYIANLKNVRSEHFKLQKIINNPSVQMADLSKIILADPILAAKILRMANSPYFGMQKKIDSISHALMILGLQNIKNILYREGLLQMFQAGSPKQKEMVAYLWKHASLTSVCASNFYDLFDGLNKGTLFTLGILHDIGKLIVLGLLQAQGQESECWDEYPWGTSILDENKLLGVNHADIGRIVLEQWNFSELMINSIGMHHAPSFLEPAEISLSGEQRNYVLVLFMADQVAKLFAKRDNGAIHVNTLHNSYHKFFDRNRLIGKVMDAGFLAQIREAEAIAISEYKGATADKVVNPDNQMQTGTLASSAGAAGKEAAFRGEATLTIKGHAPERKIGRYDIIRELGHGSMGTVFLGRDPLINRDVAIKTLRHGDTHDAEMLHAKSQFFREAEAIGKLTHPNIVAVYDVGDYQGTAYMAMELLEGTNLMPYCNRDNLLPVPETLRVISAVADALEYAHANGVVHRDIKPGNVRILKNGNVKVVDFGIAKMVDTSGTHPGVIIGSPSYMSPEQVEGHKVDGRSDLFSLGVLFYELLTGEKPFKGDNISSLFFQITTANPTPVQELVPHIPAGCAVILEKALAKNRDARYQLGQEIVHDLTKCLTRLQ